MNDLTLIKKDGIFYADSREVAEMTEKRHSDLLESISNYVKTLDSILNGKFRSVDFFITNTYQDPTGRTLPCYLLTRKGCDMVANKMTGEKGVLFTAAYVSRFEEMEHQLQQPQITTTNPYILALIDIDQKHAVLVERATQLEVSQKAMEARVKDLENTLTLERAFFGPVKVPTAPPVNSITPATKGDSFVEECRKLLPPMAEKHTRQRTKPSKLRRLRMEKEFSSEEVARIAGISKSHLNRIEIGKSDPSYKTIRGIAKALGATPAKIMSLLPAR
jgi:Rha family phage regulatory protein